MKHPGLINKSTASQPEKFEWTEKNIKIIDDILKKYPKKRKQSAVMPILYLAQNQNNGWLSYKAIEKVSETLCMSFIRVMEIATFYSMFNLNPVGKNFIQICRTTPCWLRGSEKLKKVAENFTGCKVGETSKDNLFTLVEVECLGACCNSPVIQINDQYYEDLNEENLLELLHNIKDNNKINFGSQIGRIGSEPIKTK